MSDITINIEDGQLGQVPASIANAVVQAGICAAGVVNELQGFGDTNVASSTLGPGPLTENVADTIDVAGACLAAPINPSVAGSMGAVTHLGTGAGTVATSLAPAVQIQAKIVTGGALGVMQVQFSLNGAAYGPVFTSTASAFSILVPGTLTVLTFAAQTYTTAAVWTISTAGVISLTGTGTVGWVTQVSSPLDAYDLFVEITTAGALGVAQFEVSVDGNGGNSTSAPILVPGGGVYVVPNTGIVLTFASTFVLDDTYESIATPAAYTGSDVSAMLTAIGNSAQEYILVHIIGMGANSAAAASMAATVDTSMTAFQTAYRYVFAVIECPMGESQSTIAAAFQNFASDRIMVCVGDIQHISSLDADLIRRNFATVVVSRLALINPSEDPGWVGRGKLANVKSIYYDEAKTPGLATQRFTVPTTRPKKQGYFCKTGLMMAASGSDYASVMNRRVMDVLCDTTVGAVVDNVNQDLLVNKADGTIYDPEATKIERFVVNEANAELLSPSPPDATSISASINRTENILETGDYTIAVGCIPKGYSHKIFVNIGFVNPGLAS
jgi:Protein of unknown function (DUF2586)